MKLSQESALGNTKIHEAHDSKLAYAKEFRQLLRAHPQALSDFQRIEERVMDNALEGIRAGDDRQSFIGHYEEGEVQVDLLDAVGSTEGVEDGPGGIGEYMKASVAGEEFFVKRSAGLPSSFIKDTLTGHSGSSKRSLGVEEFKSMQKAREMLHDIPGVEVIDFQFAYQRVDDDIETTYFVSKWIDGAVRLDLYTAELAEKLAGKKVQSDAERLAVNAKLDELAERYDRVCEVLGNEFDDVRPHNIMYDEARDMFILFDIHESADSERWREKDN